ncbi:hypothetical protein D9758_017123 [Tetrapyrgos nigripes]|uniref:C2H2-type domain-containing protein n=1 Tax=Tetrapyrgos nigripes TaxID=182062 RepID=A0A8H5CJA6_9AGAR|nr:hypothetical protein D9758_017123 [Tetrapyrgos nigripes]
MGSSTAVAFGGMICVFLRVFVFLEHAVLKFSSPSDGVVPGGYPGCFVCGLGQLLSVDLVTTASGSRHVWFCWMRVPAIPFPACTGGALPFFGFGRLSLRATAAGAAVAGTLGRRAFGRLTEDMHINQASTTSAVWHSSFAMVRQIKRVQCPECGLKVKSEGGLKRHIEAKHAEPQPDPPAPRFPTPDLNSFNTPPPQSRPPSPVFSSQRSPRRRQNGSPVRLQWSAAPLDLRKYGTHVEMAHPILDGTPCDQNGYDLPENSLPAPVINDNKFNDWAPFQNATEFKLAEFLYHKVQMSAGDIDTLLQLISELMAPERSDNVPFHNHREMYGLIDAIRQGEIQWESFTVKFNGDLPEDQSPLPAWKQQEYQVWFRDPLAIMEQMLANLSFKTEMDVSPKRLFKNGKRLYRDLMTGNWAWTQCDEIAEDESTHGAMFCPVILGSDKTTVSVATGQSDYYPLYISLGNVHSSVRHAHRNAVALLGFLAIPKTSQDHAGGADFRKFR